MSRTRRTIIGILLCFLAGEIVAGTFHQRAVDSGAYPQIYRSSDVLPWELIPGATDIAIRTDEPEFRSDIRINSLGYRGPEFHLDKPPDTYRILFLGDSFVFGWGVQEEQAVSRVLESLLQERTSSARIEVINAGYAAGYSPDAYYVYLRHRGIHLDPDLVILGFLPRNDIENISDNELVLDSSHLPTQVRSWREFIDEDRRRYSRSRLEFLSPIRQHSNFIDWLVVSLHSLYAPARSVEFMTKPKIQETEKAWQTAQVCLRATAQLLKGLEPPPRFLVVVFPDSLQVHRQTWDTLRLRFNETLYSEAYPQRRLASMAHDEGLTILDLLPGMRARGQTQRLYFTHDGHWNWQGHSVAAELISDFLLQTDWVRLRG